MIKQYNQILQIPNPILRNKSKNIKSLDQSVINLLNDLKRLAKENSKEGITLVGLSAPQVGENLNLFVYYDLQKEQYIEVINPKVIYQTKELTFEWEGCASVGTGEKSLFGPVGRSKTCQIQYLDITGKEQIVSASNYQSHILLHEMDHLDGIIFLDRVQDPKMIITAKELDDYARKHGGKYPKLK